MITLAIHTHARIAGPKIWVNVAESLPGNPHPRANCGATPLQKDALTTYWQSTPTRELRDDVTNALKEVARLAIHTHARIAGSIAAPFSPTGIWQSTPTRELRVLGHEGYDKIKKLAIHTHARIAGVPPCCPDSNPQLAIHTHARIAGAIRMQL